MARDPWSRPSTTPPCALEGDPDARIEGVMEPGPSPVRPQHGRGQAGQAPLRARLETAIATTREGAMLGVVRRRDPKAPLTEDA